MVPMGMLYVYVFTNRPSRHATVRYTTRASGDGNTCTAMKSTWCWQNNWRV